MIAPASPPIRHGRRAHQRGVGLVELMVAMVIGLILIAGAISVFMQGKNTNRTTDSVSRMQEALTYALDTIEPDVRMANFWGLTNRPDFVTNTATSAQVRSAVDSAVTVNCNNNYSVDLNRYVDGADNGTWPLLCAGAFPTAWSDVLTIRRASAAATAPTAGRIQIQTTRRGGTLFRDGVIPAGYAAAPASETHDIIVDTYYIGRVPVAGTAQWALRRKTLTVNAAGAPTINDAEVIRGIWDLQVQFGVDTNNDGNADVYVNPGAAELATGRVVSVKLWLGAVAEDPEQGYVNDIAYTLGNQAYAAPMDNRRRMVLQKTIMLRNVTGSL
jgi:type IV pilus assembly protein PilW